MKLVKFELAYGHESIMVNPERVYLIQEARDGIRIFLDPGEGKINYTVKERSILDVAKKLDNGG